MACARVTYGLMFPVRRLAQSSEQRDGIIMYQQTAKTSIVDKLVIGMMTIMLLVAGFFASLLALAIGGSVALFVVGKAWWLKRRHEKTVIEGEYQVIRK